MAVKISQAAVRLQVGDVGRYKGKANQPIKAGRASGSWHLPFPFVLLASGSWLLATTSVGWT
jgi:hypothetical protein